MEYATQCLVTHFKRIKESDGGKSERIVDKQEVVGCRIFCSYSEKNAGVDVRVNDIMVSLNLMDVMEMIKTAAEENCVKFTQGERL